MSEVLVVAELVDGAVTKPTLELLTLARRLGDPVVVVFGDGAEAWRRRSASTARPGSLSVTDPAIDEFLVAPKAEALEQVAAVAAPAAVLISSTAEGKEIAGRLAVKLGSGLITDATDIAADGTTTQSVFAGNWTVTASVTQGARWSRSSRTRSPRSRPRPARRGAGRGDHLRRGQDRADRRHASRSRPAAGPD